MPAFILNTNPIHYFSYTVMSPITNVNFNQIPQSLLLRHFANQSSALVKALDPFQLLPASEDIHQKAVLKSVDGDGQALAGSRDFKSAKIPGFLNLKSRDFLTLCFGLLGTLFRQKSFSLFIRVIPSRKIPGFGQIPSRKIPGLKILIPLGPDDGDSDQQ